MNLESEVLQINLDDIIPNRFQPRIAFDETGLKELADSIKEHGIIQPLVLRKLGKKYEIIAGERRYKAATLAGLETVPAIISNIDDNKSAEVALVENIQRRDLTPIEEAKSYKSLLDKGYLTQEQLAKKMGISQPAIANKLRLLNLDEEVQQALLAEKISERHARALLQIENKTKQKEWLNRTINERLTVRQLDQEIKKALAEEDVTGDIPLVSLTPTIEEIKANAQDINTQTEKKEINLLEDTITKEEKTPIIETLSDGKFFNFSNNNEILDLNENKEQKTNANELEIIDMPSLINEKMDTNDELKLPEEPLVTSAIKESNIDFNANNKFFTPFMEDASNNELDILSPKEEVIVDPMENINLLEPVISIPELEKEEEKEDKKDSTKETNNISIAISKIRELIEELKQSGININNEEMDLVEEYKFDISIKKENE